MQNTGGNYLRKQALFYQNYSAVKHMSTDSLNVTGMWEMCAAGLCGDTLTLYNTVCDLQCKYLTLTG